MASTICPTCKHSSSQHYAGCMEEIGETECETLYCQCAEQFNLSTGVRLPNRGELIALLERAADQLQEYATDIGAEFNEHRTYDSLAMEILRKLNGE
jgi:hypothetical protein